MNAVQRVSVEEPFTVETYETEQDWLAARSTFIGASEAAAILGVSPWSSPMKVFAAKIGAESPRSRKNDDLFALGHVLEPLIASRYVAATGQRLRNLGAYTVVRSKRYPFLGATLDRVIDVERPGSLEMKTVNWFDEEWDDGVPQHYGVQHQHQLAVTGYEWGSIAALSRVSGEFRHYPSGRHEPFIESLVEQLADFWERTQRGEAPTADGSKATSEALFMLYPEGAGGEVALPEDFERWDAQRVEADAAIDAAKERKEEAQNHIKAAIGAAKSGRLPSGVLYSWGNRTVETHEVRAYTSRVLTRRKAPKGKK